MKQPARGSHLLAAWRSRPRWRGAVAAAVLLLLGGALVPDAARVMRALGRAAVLRLAEWPDFERALALPGSGQDALPPAVTATVDALVAAGGAFRVSEGVTDDFLRQRISEAAWPLPIDPAAPVVVRMVDEPSPCKLLAQNSGVAVDRCD